MEIKQEKKKVCFECGFEADLEHDGFYYCESDYVDMVAEDPLLLEAQMDMTSHFDRV